MTSMTQTTAHSYTSNLRVDADDRLGLRGAGGGEAQEGGWEEKMEHSRALPHGARIRCI
jgi:hypothetical protein